MASASPRLLFCCIAFHECPHTSLLVDKTELVLVGKKPGQCHLASNDVEKEDDDVQDDEGIKNKKENQKKSKGNHVKQFKVVGCWMQEET